MQLQLHSLPVKRCRKRKSAGGNRHLQDAKKHARQVSLDEVAGGGLANSRYRGATCFRPLLHPFSRVVAQNGVYQGYQDSARLLVKSCWPKIEGLLRKSCTKIEKWPAIVRWGCGYIGTLPRGANWRSPATKFKRSRIACAITTIALSLTNLESKLLELTAQSPIRESRYPHFSQFSTIFDFSKKKPNFGVFAKNLSKVRLQKLFLFCSPVFPSWAERDLIPLLFSWYKTYRWSLLASTCKSNTADFEKRWVELDPKVCEQRGACGYLDLYM